MENERDKQPLDDLFAHKLGKMSLPPSPDGFERLQARMGQQNEKPIRSVRWRNPTVQRYMAVAACLLVICLFSWLYWSINSVPKGASVAILQASSERKALQNSKQNATIEQNGQVATITVETDPKLEPLALLKAHRQTNSSLKPAITVNRSTTAITQVQSPKSDFVLTEPATTVASNSATTGQLSESKPTTQAERVLVVTIEEPAVLVAARHEKNRVEEQTDSATADKPAKELKTGNLWRKMKQLRQGELLAKGNDPTDDDQGLLSRAYTGLKHSIEKGKQQNNE